MKRRKIIVRIYSNKKTGQRLVCIPKKYKELKPGDYIFIEKVRGVE